MAGAGSRGERAGAGGLALTEDLQDIPGHLTREALDRTLEFLAERLGVGETAGSDDPGATDPGGARVDAVVTLTRSW